VPRSWPKRDDFHSCRAPVHARDEPRGSVLPQNAPRMPEDEGYSFHTFERNALAHFVAVVVAHTRATAADAHTLDTLLNRVLAEHGIKSIDEFNDEVGKHLQDIEQEASP
jgi:hypothetical protein